ncbi:hypothetical protein ABPG72_014924 [Tetrahymena utriculariae]
MINNIVIALLVFLQLQSAQAAIGGIKFFIARAYMSYGAVDSKNVQTIQNAKSVGLITDIYHFPCVFKVSPQDQAQATINSFGSLYGTVWIYVETNPSSGCGWTSNVHTNCQFLVDLVHAYQSHGKLVGIYSSQYQWTTIFGAAGNYPFFTNLPIWYAHYDGVANFSDCIYFYFKTKSHRKQNKLI